MKRCVIRKTKKGSKDARISLYARKMSTASQKHTLGKRQSLSQSLHTMRKENKRHEFICRKQKTTFFPHWFYLSFLLSLHDREILSPLNERGQDPPSFALENKSHPSGLQTSLSNCFKRHLLAQNHHRILTMIFLIFVAETAPDTIFDLPCDCKYPHTAYWLRLITL